MVGVGGEFSWIVSSQAVASGPHLLFCKFKQSLVISAPGKANVDLRRNPACHWTPRDWATGSLKRLFLTLASALFHPLSLPMLWQKVCILGETPGDLMDTRALFEMETHTFCRPVSARNIPIETAKGNGTSEGGGVLFIEVFLSKTLVNIEMALFIHDALLLPQLNNSWPPQGCIFFSSYQPSCLYILTKHKTCCLWWLKKI